MKKPLLIARYGKFPVLTMALNRVLAMTKRELMGFAPDSVAECIAVRIVRQAMGDYKEPEFDFSIFTDNELRHMTDGEE